ncbi:Protein SFK1 [Spathaspora sp. JA1]|nr:Protein SFK1 [Spathaspora sp. JA1]
MLIALLSCWGAQGRPIYSFMKQYQNPVYISSIAATNLQPLFISCSGFQAIFFVGTLIIAYYLRTHYKIQPYVMNYQRILAIISFSFAIIGQLGIVFVSIFNTAAFPKVHITFLAVFIICCFIAIVFDFSNSFIFATYPEKLDPEHKYIIFGKRRYSNLYMLSFILKCVWLAVAIALVVCFGVYMSKKQRSKSAVFEWIIAFWYGLLLIMWSLDLLPSAIISYDKRHNDRQYKYQEKELVSQGSNETSSV